VESKLTLRVITPDRIVLDTPVGAVRIPGVDGRIGILKGHARMVAALEIGMLSYAEGGTDKALFVSGGFAEVHDNTVRIVSEAGERPEEIDESRARKAEERARKRLEESRKPQAGGDIDILRAQLALRRARARLMAGGYARSLT